MNLLTLFLPVLQAAPGGMDNNSIMSIVMIVGFIAIFYFLIIRPQNKRQKETEKMLSEMKKGDAVVTIGGCHGTLVSVDGDTVVIKVDENVKLKFNKSAVATVGGDKAAEKAAEKAKSSEPASEKK